MREDTAAFLQMAYDELLARFGEDSKEVKQAEKEALDFFNPRKGNENEQD